MVPVHCKQNYETVPWSTFRLIKLQWIVSVREYWMIYRGPMRSYDSSPRPTPPRPLLFLCAAGRAYLREKGGRDTRSQIIRPRESLALYKSFSTLWFQWFQPSSQAPVETMQWLNHLPSSQSSWETSTSCIRITTSRGEGGCGYWPSFHSWALAHIQCHIIWGVFVGRPVYELRL
jgi:hypothetical protein